jgi:hypothetical protein
MPKWLPWVGGVVAAAAVAALVVSGIVNQHSWSWGDFPDWITAVATLGLFIGAGFTVYYARKAFTGQADQLSLQARQLRLQQRQLKDQRKINEEQANVLKLQAQELQKSLDEREREAEERRSAQAILVFVRESRSTSHAVGQPPVTTVTAQVRNTSQQPVYDFRFGWRNGDLPESQTIRAYPVMPGEEDRDVRQFPEGEADRVNVVVIFRDRANQWWRASADGKLDYLPPREEPPHSW